VSADRLYRGRGKKEGQQALQNQFQTAQSTVNPTQKDLVSSRCTLLSTMQIQTLVEPQRGVGRVNVLICLSSPHAAWIPPTRV
jgi:hypothetical protein